MLKKLTILLSAILFLAPASVWSQSSGKYSIIFPKEWKRERKFMMRLNDLLEYAFIELNEKQFCLKCKADYYIKVHISRVMISGKSFSETLSAGFANKGSTPYEAIIFYKTKTSLRLFDADNNPIADLVLSTLSEEFNYKRKFELSGLDDPYNFMNRFAGYFNPTETDILKMMEDKIWGLKVPKF